MIRNPFKFGTIVDDPFFINRKEEIKRISSILDSENHLIITAPRRFGKSSLVFKTISQSARPVISVDLQLVTGTSDLAAQLLKRIYRVYTTQKLKQFIKQFRVIPTLSLNPVTGSPDISFQAHPNFR
jgi:AAA+ ATPase superfamily predicted ATPase